jgi:hypothetical protein
MKKKNLRTLLLFIIFSVALSAIQTVSPAYPDSLLIIGEVNHPLSLTPEELAAMPRTTVNASLYCEDDFVTSGDWTGVKLSLLLETAEYTMNALSVKFDASDGYSVTILLKEALRDDVIIAYEKDGQPETLRLVIPGANGNLWISMIDTLTLSTSTDATEEFPVSPPKPVEPSPQQPTPSPSTTPQPTHTPQSTPSTSLTPSPTTTPLNTEAPPPEWVTVATAGLLLALACASLLLYFKKRHS